jgi:cysteine desulfurase
VIYADNASTTIISEKAFEKMLPFLSELYGNASSQYSLGVKSKRAIEHSRKQIAEAIGAEPSEIIFTSGGTEGNNWVLQGMSVLSNSGPIHIITSSFEHPSILKACHTMETRGVSITYLPVGSNGLISVADVESALRSDTKLVTIMMANNEIGTIQPISEIGSMLRNRGILFHTDAVQAVGHVPVGVSDMNVDFLTASAHKFHGAKGAGALYVRSGIELPSLLLGGGQEMKLRAGTENVAGIVAAGYAIEESIFEMSCTAERISTMANDTIAGVMSRIPNVRVNGDPEKRLPGLVNLGFEGVSGESLMHLLDLNGVCVSTSSACNAGKDEPSHVLLAMGQTEKQAMSAIRISYGRYNVKEDVSSIVDAVCDAYKKITCSELCR